MYREHGQWWSPSLGKVMEFLWFGKFGRPVMLFPTSAGRYSENEDMGLAGVRSQVQERRILTVGCENRTWGPEERGKQSNCQQNSGLAAIRAREVRGR